MKWLIDYFYPRNFSQELIPDLNDKVIIVTGGCAGLGYEIASQCALHNARKIIIASFPSPRLDSAVQSISEKLTNSEGILS
jgi:NAD(P)-dependent dehydrogenase (short-subunit alcohol dehydrogenase family)